MRRLAYLLLLGVAVAWARPAAYVHGRYLVQGRGAVSRATIDRAFAFTHLVQARRLGRNRWLVRITPDPGPAAVAAAVRRLQARIVVSPDYRYRMLTPYRQGVTPR